jgi:hypothetical protein
MDFDGDFLEREYKYRCNNFQIYTSSIVMKILLLKTYYNPGTRIFQLFLNGIKELIERHHYRKGFLRERL